jgi:hypothetical protein
VDWNEDGRFDLMSGDRRGQIWVFLDTADKGPPVLAAGFRVKAAGKEIIGSRRRLKVEPDGTRRVVDVAGSHGVAKLYTKIHLADWNGDGLFDILAGYTSTIVLFENIGKKGSPAFKEPRLIRPPPGGFPVRPSPYLFDWDGDGREDLLAGSDRGGITFFKNIGSGKERLFKKGVPLKCGGSVLKTGLRSRFTITDWNNDGIPDILVGNFSVEKDPKAPRGRSYRGKILLYIGERENEAGREEDF